MQQPEQSIYQLCNQRAEVEKARRAEEARLHPLNPSRRMWRQMFFAAMLDRIKRPTEIEVFLRMGWAAVTKEESYEQAMWRRLSLGVDRICQMCGEQKPLHDYYEEPKGRYGRKATCITCMRDARNDRYNGDKLAKILRIEERFHRRKTG